MESSFTQDATRQHSSPTGYRSLVSDPVRFNNECITGNLVLFHRISNDACQRASLHSPLLIRGPQDHLRYPVPTLDVRAFPSS
jgi:hypothetical protein